MKKITLFLAAFLCIASVMQAQEIMLDFRSEAAQTAVPGTTVSEDTECTMDGYTFTINNAKISTASYPPTYLMVYSNGYIDLPVADFAVGSITVLTGESASKSVAVQLIDMSNGETVIEEKTLSEQGTEFTWTLTGQTAGTQYRLLTANNKNAQYQYIKMVAAPAEGTLSFRDAGDVAFGVGLNASQTQEVEVVADGLANDITVTVSGEGFVTTNTTLPATGGTVAVDFTGTTAGTTNGTITIESGSLSATANLVGVTAAHEGSLSDPFDTNDVTALNDKTGDTKYWVSGVIAGCASNNGALATTDVATNLALGTAEPYVPVQLPSGEVRTNLNIVDNPELKNTTVWVYGTIESYFSAPGVKDVTDFSLDGTNAWSSVENVKAVAGKAYAVNGNIVTTGNGESVAVYNLTGKLVATGVAGRDIKIAAKGLYIVKVGDKATKVVVR